MLQTPFEQFCVEADDFFEDDKPNKFIKKITKTISCNNIYDV